MSGRKNFLNAVKILNAGDVSQATLTSSVVNIESLDNIGIQINVVSGTFTGVVTVQVSADYKQDPQGNVSSTGNWVTLTLPVSAAITSSSPTNIYIDLTQLSSNWIRAVYTKTSGTGSLDMYVCGKMI